ncbi:MAG: hypothetical protein RLZZ182_176, partial [Pseudomonadota bacterium]
PVAGVESFGSLGDVPLALRRLRESA